MEMNRLTFLYLILLLSLFNGCKNKVVNAHLGCYMALHGNFDEYLVVLNDNTYVQIIPSRNYKNQGTWLIDSSKSNLVFNNMSSISRQNSSVSKGTHVYLVRDNILDMGVYSSNFRRLSIEECEKLKSDL